MMGRKLADFDEYVEKYEKLLNEQLSFFNSEREYFSAYKVDLLAELLPGPPETILDFGCGVGLSLPHFRRRFPEANIHATDISKKSLEIVRSRHPDINVIEYHDIDNHKFDVVFLAGVMHHVPPVERPALVGKLSGLLQPGGVLCIFEHNPYNPVTRRMVATCPFDEGVELISMRNMLRLLRNETCLKPYRKGYCLFFPEFLKKLRPFEKYLRWLPMGGQYFVMMRAI